MTPELGGGFPLDDFFANREQADALKEFGALSMVPLEVTFDELASTFRQRGVRVTKPILPVGDMTVFLLGGSKEEDPIICFKVKDSVYMPDNAVGKFLRFMKGNS